MTGAVLLAHGQALEDLTSTVHLPPGPSSSRHVTGAVLLAHRQGLSVHLEHYRLVKSLMARTSQLSRALPTCPLVCALDAPYSACLVWLPLAQMRQHHARGAASLLLRPDQLPPRTDASPHRQLPLLLHPESLCPVLSLSRPILSLSCPPITLHACICMQAAHEREFDSPCRFAVGREMCSVVINSQWSVRPFAHSRSLALSFLLSHSRSLFH